MSTQSVIQLKLDPETKERVERIAEAKNLATDTLVREAVEQYVSREEKREHYRNETLAAIADYERTGLHLTEEEVDTWLVRLEAGEDIEPPECHV